MVRNGVAPLIGQAKMHGLRAMFFVVEYVSHEGGLVVGDALDMNYDLCNAEVAHYEVGPCNSARSRPWKSLRRLAL